MRRFICKYTSIDPLHCLRTFDTLTRTLLQNPRNFTALKTLDSMLTRPHAIDSVASVFIVEHLSQLKKLGRAKTVVQSMRDRDKSSEHFLCSLVLDYLVKDGKIDDAEIVWDEICGDKLRIDVSNYVVNGCKYGEACDIKRICERVWLGSRVLRKEGYEALVRALCRVNDGALAKEVVREMDNKGIEVDELSYIDMYPCFCRNGDIKEADSVLKKLVRRNGPIGLCMSGDFLVALCKRGKFKEANKLFCIMVADDCCTMSKNDFLKEGKRVIFQLNFKGVVLEMVAYETYFRSLCSAGKLKEAEALLKKMRKKQYVPETCVYGSFIEALFKAGREEDALKFFNLESKKMDCSGR